jgi:hypothetical protein
VESVLRFSLLSTFENAAPQTATETILDGFLEGFAIGDGN